MIREAVKKYFMVRLTVRGGRGVTAPSLTVSKCENFDLFSPLEYDSLMHKTHFISL